MASRRGLGSPDLLVRNRTRHLAIVDRTCGPAVWIRGQVSKWRKSTWLNFFTGLSSRNPLQQTDYVPRRKYIDLLLLPDQPQLGKLICICRGQVPILVSTADAINCVSSCPGPSHRVLGDVRVPPVNPFRGKITVPWHHILTTRHVFKSASSFTTVALADTSAKEQ